MHEDDNWQVLSEQWNQQKVNKEMDIDLIKSRINKHKIRIYSLITLDLMVMGLTAYLLYWGLTNDYSWGFISWVGFGLIFSIIVAAISTKERLINFNPIVTTTQQWFDYELARAKSRLFLAKLTQISVVIFAVFFHLWLLLGYFYDDSFQLGMNVKSIFLYVFGLVWISLFWFIALYYKHKAIKMKKHYIQESEFLNE